VAGVVAAGGGVLAGGGGAEPGGSAAPAGSAAGGAAAGQPVRGGTLRVAWQGEPTGPNGGLDPQTCTSNCYPVHQHVWDTLVRVNYDVKPEPLLAESWTTSQDGKTWTFKLRSGVKHHHGTPFTSADVVHTFKRILDPQTGAVVRTVLSVVDDVTAPDPQTAVFHLSSPNADLLYLLAVPQTAILPRDRTDEQLRTEPVGTGPFRFVSFGRGERIVMQRNPDYWQKGLPYLDELQYLLMPEPNARIAALTGGRVDMIGEVAPEMVAPLQQPGIKVDVVPSGNVNLIAMRMDQEPFTDNRIREAFKLVADRKAIEQVSLLGTGTLGNDHPFYTKHPFYDPSQTIAAQDIAKAKQLLADAGYPNGIAATLHLDADRPLYKPFALAYQEQAKQAGITITLQHHPDAAYWSDVYLKQPLFMSSWNFRPSPDELVSIMFHSEAKWNETGVKSPELDDMIVKARGELDEERRKQLYYDIQRWVRTNAGVIIPIFGSTISAYRDTVQGYRVHPVPWYLFHTTWLKK
jgi:peptide/nickel transport system substrate-binding protein